LPLTLRRLEWRRSDSNRHLPRCKRDARPLSYIPSRSMRTGGVEPPQHEATGLQPAELAGAQRPREGGWPAGVEPAPTGVTSPGASVYTTATMKGLPGEAGTTGLEPAASRLTSERSTRLSYAPDSAGGIRTHGLELMRLARTASPLPRRSGRQESNLRSPAPEAGGVAYSPTARRSCKSTPGGTRTRSFRVEGPASSPVRPRGQEQAPAAGLEPASRD
jgi:hypothetical protein